VTRRRDKLAGQEAQGRLKGCSICLEPWTLCLACSEPLGLELTAEGLGRRAPQIREQLSRLANHLALSGVRWANPPEAGKR